MSMHFNAKYNEQGSIFQGSFRSRTIDTDAYLRYCAAYVMVKNPFELAPGGLVKAITHFDDAWRWALAYPHSSLPVYGAHTASPIIETEANILKELFHTSLVFKTAAHDMFLAHIQHRDNEVFDTLLLEKW